MSQYVNYAEFINLLKGLVNNRSSANIMMVTDDHHSLRIAVRNGAIESLAIGLRKGAAAIPLLRTIQGGSLRMSHDRDLLPATPDLPDTHTILHLLEQEGGETATPSPRSTPKPRGLTSMQVEAFIAELQPLMQRYLGPIAALLISTATEDIGEIQTIEQLEQLLVTLESEVEGIGDHRAFLQEAQRLMEQLL